jgi:hypothetical protein
MAHQSALDPICNKCQQAMAWVAEHIIDSKPIAVFHCESCGKYAAVQTAANDPVSKAPRSSTGL